jgi:polysaccharide pyruvyl transferase WcaK-like protein
MKVSKYCCEICVHNLAYLFNPREIESYLCRECKKKFAICQCGLFMLNESDKTDLELVSECFKTEQHKKRLFKLQKEDYQRSQFNPIQQRIRRNNPTRTYDELYS